MADLMNMINFPDGMSPESPPESDVQQVKRFPSLRSAGHDLALELRKYREAKNVVVLAIVAGGVPVAHELAISLEAPLDLVIIRRLLAPEGPGSQLCAVSVGGSMVIDKELMPLPAIPSSPLEHFVSDAFAELNEREQSCRSGRQPIDLRNRIVILADCGIRTGSTMRAAIAALRKMKPAQIIAAVPVTSLGGHAAVTALADEVVYLARPQPFGHVGLWYTDFSRPSDERIGDLLEPVQPG